MNKIFLLSLCFSIASCKADSDEFSDPFDLTAEPSFSESSPTPLGLSTPEDATLEEEPMEFQCPPEWFLIQDTMASVGANEEVFNELDPKGYSVSRVPLYTASVASFCISPFPYPGVEGSQWPEGMNLAQASDLDLELEPFGMHFATGSEYLVAVGTAANHRWPQASSSWEASGCDPDPYNPSVMGSHPSCVSSWGPGALLTFAFWVKTDQSLKDVLLQTTNGVWGTVEPYIVMGGMPSDWYAYYGDDLWGAHQHGDEDPYWDDKPGFLVSVPWGVTSKQWEDFQSFRATKRLARTNVRRSLKNHRRPVVE